MITFWGMTAFELAAFGALVYGIERVSVTAAIILGAFAVLAGCATYEWRRR